MISTKVNKNLKQMLLKMEEAINESAHVGKHISICKWKAKLTDSCCLISLQCVCVCVSAKVKSNRKKPLKKAFKKAIPEPQN